MLIPSIDTIKSHNRAQG